MPPLLRALRPQEWIKNLLVFAGVLFSGRLDQTGALADALITFAAFCAISSAGYLLNDLRDREHDRLHPEKRDRPLASGIVALYGVITTAYSLGLKRLVIIDVMTIGSLFILRVVAGAVAVGAHASEFLLVCTGFLALFLGFTKRRQEAMLEEQEATAAGTRPVLEHYSIPFLDQMIAMVTASAILSYVIYTVDSPRIGSEMLATAPSVLYGIFRYLYLVYDRRDTRSTAAILTEDPGMIFAGITWVGTALAMLYLFD
jgi:4-hydroxybenzoate polyprenyltransferase